MSDIDNDVYDQIKNRLLSIIHDRHYVETDVLKISKVNIAPIPNARCGNWYTSNTENIESYFKSTDGHKDHWGFNYRRLNMHILEKILEWRSDNRVMMIVDSSKYRQIPDSLSKTIPIWCCVLSLFINKEYFTKGDVIIEERFKTMTEYLLELPVQMENVREEADQIKENVLGFYKTACLYLPDFHERLRLLVDQYSGLNTIQYIKIKPDWIYPGHNIEPEEILIKENGVDGYSIQVFNLLLCSTSSFSRISRHHGNDKYQRNIRHNKFNFDFDYYQGAGDDHEMWGMNMISPKMFNDNIEKFEKLLMNKELEITELIFLLKSLGKSDTTDEVNNADVYVIDELKKVFITNNDRLNSAVAEQYDIVIILGSSELKATKKINVFKDLTDDKRGVRTFFKDIEVIEAILSNKKDEDSILFSSEKFDLNIACILIYLIKYTDINNFDKSQWSKVDIRQVYLKILERINVETKTSRIVLNNVNSYIMS